MTTKQIVSGVGVRLMEVFPLDTADGLPSCNTSSATPVTGTLIEGIKSFTYTDPDVQRVTHYGDDNPFAADALPPAEVGKMAFTTAKSNLKVDAMLEGTKVASIDGLQMRAANSNKRGQEPQVLINVFRQALDTDKTSATFGKLRQWHGALVPSVRVSPKSQSMEQGATDKSYDGTPTPVAVTPWNQAFDETTWGATQGEYIEYTADYNPRMNVWRGNGTLTAFNLSKAPVDAAHLHVWQDGTLVTPSAVNTSTANPAFTLGSPAPNAKKLIAIIEHNGSNNT